MAEPLSAGTIDLLINLGDKMADMLSEEEKRGAAGSPAEQVIEQYARARTVYSEISTLVQLFNQRVAENFDQSSAEPLRDLLTAGAYTRIENNFREWRKAGIRTLKLDRYELLAVRQPEAIGDEIVGRQAQAYTLEMWIFGREDGSSQKEESFNQYNLDRAETGWLIRQVEFYTKG